VEAAPVEAAPVEAPAVGDLRFVHRESMMTLQELRFKRANNSAIRQLGLVAAELGLGLTFALAPDKLGVQSSSGVTMLSTAALGGLSVANQLRSSQRSHGEFLAQLASIEGGSPERYLALAEESRLAMEREAQFYAFSMGTNVGILGLGLMGVLAGAADESKEGAWVLTAVGALGTAHYAMRWDNAVRMSKDFAVLDGSQPTMIEPE